MLISTLQAQPQLPSQFTPISIKLNADLINKFKACLKNGVKVKLIVKDGQYLIKMPDNELNYPCPATAENSRTDIYGGDENSFKGRISTRLNVLTDSKLIKDYTRRQQLTPSAIPPVLNAAVSASVSASASASALASATTPNASKVAVTSTTAVDSIPPSSSSLSSSLSSSSSKNPTPSSTPQPTNSTPALPIIDYASSESPISRFLYFSALGPISLKSLCSSLKLTPLVIRSFLDQYSQIYNPNDSFIIDDIFPRSTTPNGPETYILKDKSYKEVKPWNWSYYSDDERSLIIHNIHNALTRLGFLETHPLRKKLTKKSTSVEDEESPKRQTLGGGILKLKEAKIKRSSTVSPRPQSIPPLSASAPPTAPSSSLATFPSNGSPLKKRKLSLSSTSSSEDEKPLSKKIHRKKDIGNIRGRTSSNGGSTSSTISTNGNSTSGIVISDTYTSPSSINEELEQETSPPATAIPYSTTRTISASTSAAPAAVPLASTSLESKNQKKLQFYTNLSLKFKLKYKDYEKLYKILQTTTISSSLEKKKNLTKLFELHNQLSEWKRKLWDFDSESKLKLNIMTLSKHKKTPAKVRKISQPTVPTVTSSAIPGSLTVPLKTQSLSPSIPPTRELKKNPRLPVKPTMFNKTLDY